MTVLNVIIGVFVANVLYTIVVLIAAVVCDDLAIKVHNKRVEKMLNEIIEN